MQPISGLPVEVSASIEYVLMDIDDTLTTGGVLPAAAYTALEQLKQSGRKVVPITGRPAGWCDHIARMWPVDAIVGENGAFYFRYNREEKRMHRRFWKTEPERASDRIKLEGIRDEILENIPGAAVASDQVYREADLAIDFCEDVPRLEAEAINRIVESFQRRGAKAKISSIHVNGWFGDYDKLEMTKILFREVFGHELDAVRGRILFAGDSPNDEPMFGYFPESAGVANVMNFQKIMKIYPKWVAEKEGGEGFAEIAKCILAD